VSVIRERWGSVSPLQSRAVALAARPEAGAVHTDHQPRAIAGATVHRVFEHRRRRWRPAAFNAVASSCRQFCRAKARCEGGEAGGADGGIWGNAIFATLAGVVAGPSTSGRSISGTA